MEFVPHSDPDAPTAPVRPSRTKRHELIRLMAGLLALVGAGIGGFYVGVVHQDWGASENARPTNALDDFLTASSFSEIVNAQDVLQAAATRTVTQLRIPYALASARLDGAQENCPPSADPRATVVAGLRAGIEEFRGTEQELFLVQHLLWLLHANGDQDGYVTLYLDTLYHHPTHPMIMRNAAEAWRTAEIVDRKDEITRAFRHLEAIPFALPAKGVVSYLLGETTAAAD